MPDELEPKLIIDTDWKAQAQAEKAKLSESAKQAKAPGSPAGAGPGGAASGAPGGAGGAAGAERLGFEDLVSMLATQALQYMGAFPDPRTGKAVVALEYARVYIDLLGILEEKTKGNLNEREQAMMTRTAGELRLEFVELAKEIDKAVAEGRITPMGGATGKGGGVGGVVVPKPGLGGGAV
ncbi:MAG: DUF1844 domain-containing protein [Phycisphaeraceae bacterium]|nr:MAG: DUF1844 domain-containing protein [Phycisphaeraceae bacterium]